MDFLMGFLFAGVLGFLSSLFLKSWNSVQKTQKQMFVDPPIPALKDIIGAANKDISGLGTNPNQSPINVLSSGCVSIIGQTLLQFGLIAIGVIIIFWVSLQKITTDAWYGVIYAGIFGVLTHNIRSNWKVLTNLYKKIVNPPASALSKLDPPNDFLVGARPAAPAFTLVINSFFEMMWRSVWLLILVALLILAISSLFAFLWKDSFQIPSPEIFDVVSVHPNFMLKEGL